MKRIVALGCLGAIAALVGMGSFAPGKSIAAAGRGLLFGTDGGPGNLILVNRKTGAGTVVGNMGRTAMPSLATDPKTGTLYAGGGGGVSDIYIVDPSTTALTFVGDTGLGFSAVGGLDFRSDGVLFAVVNLAGDGGTGSDHLARIDKSTGTATVIGSFGTCTGVVIPTVGDGSCSIDGIEAIAFDRDGKLWGALSARGAAGTPGLYRINPRTGKARFLTRLHEDDSGVEPSGGVVSLQFGCNDDRLYGGTATAISPGTDGGRLIKIDPDDGEFKFVGNVSATEGSSLAALAFLGGCADDDD